MQGPDEIDGLRDRNAQVEAGRARRFGCEGAVGLLEEVAIRAGAERTEDVESRLWPGVGQAVEREPGGLSPKPRIGKDRPIAGAGVLHDAVVCPAVVLALRGDLANEIDTPGLVGAGADAQVGERYDHDGGPLSAGRVARSGSLPVRAVARVFAGLLVANAAGRRLEEIRLGSRSARVERDADEVVDAEAALVGGLRGENRRARLFGLESNIQIVIVIQQIGRRRVRGGAAGGHVLPRASAVRNFARLPRRIGQARVER